MIINIKSDETLKLVHELAELTGETATIAVSEALRERLDRGRRLRGSQLAVRIMKIGQDCAGRLKETILSKNHAKLL
jgi:antitoxin VapB